MKLTNTIRDAFIKAAMQDVPSVNYAEEVRKLVQAEAIKILPPKVKAVHDDVGTRYFLNTQDYYERITGNYVRVFTGDRFELPAKLIPKLQDIKAKQMVQGQRDGELRAKLRSCAYGCSTRKALVTMLPEFEKYLPAESVAACRSVPVVAEMVEAFTKAGWPKGKSRTQKEKVAA